MLFAVLARQGLCLGRTLRDGSSPICLAEQKAAMKLLLLIV